MIEFEYLRKGICGLARAHRANTMAGHLGAAVIAGYFFGENHHELDARVAMAIQRELDRIIGGDESIWFNAEKAGISIAELFAPLPSEQPQPKRVDEIAKCLARNIGKLRQSGHNVIFASIAIRALRDHPELATPSAIDGICKLIRGFDGAVPGRGYYGKQKGWMTGDKVRLQPDRAAGYQSSQQMAEAVIEQLIGSAFEHRRGFGGLFHVINHATGLIELGQFENPELSKQGYSAHRHHVRLWSSLPNLDEELGVLKRANHDPRTPDYWTHPMPSQWSAQLTHRVKTLYGFYSLLDLIEDRAKREEAEKAFLYLMA